MADLRLQRNFGIAAHIDAGKTTTTERILRYTGMIHKIGEVHDGAATTDWMEQEKERGITITSAAVSCQWNFPTVNGKSDANTKSYYFNIIDTPGHADFSGEVERTLNMADGVLLIVDAQEGPMPQTKFVLSKALELGLRPVVIINKVDKPARRIAEVEDELADLFLELATDESQLHYPVYYAVARDGKAWKDMPANPDESATLTPVFEAIVGDIDPPEAKEGSLQLVVAALARDNFLGKYAIGRVVRGEVAKNMQVVLMKADGQLVNSKIERVFVSRGLGREEVDAASSGDIVALTGIAEAHIGDTVAGRENPEALPVIQVEAPTISMYLGPNTSPMKGREAEYNTSRQIGDRLQRELETNVALKVRDEGIGFIVSGRGELHLSVLIESMRREGYEFEVGRPQVVTIQEDGQEKEPVEELLVEVAPEFVGVVSQELGLRRAELVKQEQTSSGLSRITYIITTRALIGLRNLLLTATKGTVIMHSLPHGYQALGPKLSGTRNGALVAFEAGTTTPYALETAEARGELFVGPGTEVYGGMIVGLYNRQEDLEINVCKEKHLTNMRSKSSDGTVQLTPYTQLSLEQCIDFLNDDELLEVTPKSLRLRKRYLDSTERKRHAKA